jgi:FixJ family two-component response regulator
MAGEPLVVVVDDDRRVCQSVTRTLVGAGYRVRSYERSFDFLREVPDLSASCVVADVCLPELDGLALHRATESLGLSVPTVYMTGSGDVPTIVEAMREGAVDVLEKPFEERALLSAVAIAVERAERAGLERERAAAMQRVIDRLTPREAEVAAFVATGRLNKQIAAAIGTTEKTVKVHRARALRKLGVDSVAQLVRFLDRAVPRLDRARATLVARDGRPYDPAQIVAATFAAATPPL